MKYQKGKKPHVLAVPCPAQGHVTPLMKLSCLIANHGIKVTFVNTEEIHQKIRISADLNSDHNIDLDNNVVLASVPDGMACDEDRNNGFKLLESLKNTMPRFLIELIERINSSNGDEKVSCVIADITLGYVLEIAEEMGAEPVAFTPASAAGMAMTLYVPKLIERGEVDINGTISKNETISLSENIPPWNKDEMTWSFPIDLKTQKIFFECILTAERTTRQAKWLLCNTCNDLESDALGLNPNMLSIGPFLMAGHSESSVYSSSFRTEDESSLNWLNDKPVDSVIYDSFGSVAVLSQDQIDELALGLELSGRPFLWVVRSDLANGSRAEFPNGFLDRVGGGVGKIVEWAPQEKVLSHPSVACFLSHCGWNSTLEGLSRGLTFLCWPYFADQFHNQNYICDKWKIGWRIELDHKKGMRTRHEIKRKIEMLLSDDNLKINARNLKSMVEKSIGEGGSSTLNLERFINHIRE